MIKCKFHRTRDSRDAERGFARNLFALARRQMS